MCVSLGSDRVYVELKPKLPGFIVVVVLFVWVFLIFFFLWSHLFCDTSSSTFIIVPTLSAHTHTEDTGCVRSDWNSSRERRS